MSETGAGRISLTIELNKEDYDAVTHYKTMTGLSSIEESVIKLMHVGIEAEQTTERATGLEDTI